MAISGLTIQARKGETEQLQKELQAFPQLSVEAISPKEEIVAVLEEKTLDQLHKTCLQIKSQA